METQTAPGVWVNVKFEVLGLKLHDVCLTFSGLTITKVSILDIGSSATILVCELGCLPKFAKVHVTSFHLTGLVQSLQHMGEKEEYLFAGFTVQL